MLEGRQLEIKRRNTAIVASAIPPVHVVSASCRLSHNFRHSVPPSAFCYLSSDSWSFLLLLRCYRCLPLQSVLQTIVLMSDAVATLPSISRFLHMPPRLWSPQSAQLLYPCVPLPPAERFLWPPSSSKPETHLFSWNKQLLNSS